MASPSPLVNQDKNNNKKKRHLLSLLSLLIPLALAPSLTNRFLRAPEITLPIDISPKASILANESSPIQPFSTSLPRISPQVSAISQIAPSPLLNSHADLLSQPKTVISGGGFERLQLKSTREIVKQPKGTNLSPRLGSPLRMRTKRKKRRRKGNKNGDATKTSGVAVADGDADDGVCNMYRGMWVKDEEGRYPLYSPGQCPFVNVKFACQENGRNDSEYLKWRWKPYSCDLPRFNATDFLEVLRGKKLMFVGDSMARNQFGSLLCILREAFPIMRKEDEKKVYKTSKEQGQSIVNFLDYNCSIIFAKSCYLLSQEIHNDQLGKTRLTLMLDRIDRFASTWKNVDILIFNSGYWWNLGKTNSGKNFFLENGMLYPQLDLDKAYKRGLQTWAAWIDNNLTPEKHTVFFRGQGTSHFRGGAWYNGGKCSQETEPIFEGDVLNEYPFASRIAEEIIGRMRFPVTYMNITRLTNFRKDGHPSIYSNLFRKPGSTIQPEDCGHWCLPGVPDTWNELLYANLKMIYVKED